MPRLPSIAIIGYATRLPKTSDPHFWEDLRQGKNLLSQVEPNRWAQSAFWHPRRSHPGTSVTFAAGSLGDVAGFDAGFFRISPREAVAMDPQQRLLLEMSWEALERAGLRPRRLRGSNTGVFVGLASTDYAYRNADDFAAIGPNSATGATASIAANRISFVYDWRGPSFVVDTACSSGMVAFHLACMALARGDCDLALAGAINLHLHPYGFLIFSKASMLSPQGLSRPFAAGADGYVRSEGGGVFVLKPLDRARRDGDRILAVVVATGMNTDGNKSGITVPRAETQAALLEKVYAQAGLAPEDLHYLEAHGTGTAVGDPIELEAIGLALARHRRQALPVGSVKSNLGHLETASAVPGLLKAIHCLREREIPPSIGAEEINPKLPLDRYPLDIVRERRSLPQDGVLHIGVNSFGFGGANAHALLQSPPRWRRPQRVVWNPSPTPTDGWRPLLLTGAEAQGLRALAAELADFLETLSRREFERAIYQQNFRREALGFGVAFWFRNRDDLGLQLRQFADGAEVPVVVRRPDWRDARAAVRGVVLIYSGNGCQWPGMGRALLSHPVARAVVEEIDTTFAPLAGYRLVDELLREDSLDLYDSTARAQPALFALQVAQTQLAVSFGAEPLAVVGHSVGEVAAAWACGALTLAEAARVIYYRSIAQERTRGLGQMTAVAVSPEVLPDLLRAEGLDSELHLAAINSPRGVTVVGAAQALDRLERVLKTQGIACKRLGLDYPFHGPAMDSLRDELRNHLASLQPRAERIPFLSTVTGKSLPGTSLDGEYWWHNVREPVRFAEAAERSLEQSPYFLELGGHPVLRGYLREIFEHRQCEGHVVGALRRGQGDAVAALRQAVGELWAAGLDKDLQRYYPQELPPLDLPPYPWQRQRFWQEPTAESYRLLQRDPVHELLGHALAQHPHTWEQVLDLATQSWLRDHRVGDSVLLAGAAFLEIVLAAGHEIFPESEGLCVENFEILAPLVLEEEHSRILRTHWAEGLLHLRSRAQMGDGWVEHVRAEIRPLGHQRPQAWPSLTGGVDVVDAQTHYVRTAQLGLHYGPAFRTVRAGSRLGDRLDGALERPMDQSTGPFYLDPRVLDGAFQLFVDLLADDTQREALPYVPVRIDRVDWWGSAEPLSSARLHLLRRSPHSVLADLQMVNTSGLLCVRCVGLRLQQARLAVEHGRPLPRYFVSHLERVRAPDAPSALDASALHEALEHFWRSDALLSRWREEFLPLLQSYLEMGDDPNRTRLWRTLLEDYPEHLAWTLAVGRGASKACGLEVEAAGSVFLEDWQARDLQLWAPRIAAFLAQTLTQQLGEGFAFDDLAVAEFCDGGWTLLPPLGAGHPHLSLWGLLSEALEDEASWPRALLGEIPQGFPKLDLLWAQLASEPSDPGGFLDRIAPLLRPGALLLCLGVEAGWLAKCSGMGIAPSAMDALGELAQTRAWTVHSLGEGLGPRIMILQAPAAERGQTQDDRRRILYLGRGQGALLSALQRRSRVLVAESGDLIDTSDVPSAEIWIHAPVLECRTGSWTAHLATQTMRLRDIARVCRKQVGGSRLDLLLPGALRPRGRPEDLAAAALAAFARSLINEWSDLSLRILDLDLEQPAAVEAALAALLDPEPSRRELTWDDAGRCWIPRTTVYGYSEPVQGDGARLITTQSGQLKYLAWETCPADAQLASESVEVEVEAAGLNFRDVMYALGLLGDEALEAGFAGPGLGLEFAGTIRRVGANVTDFRPGDRVLGFGPYSLASRVVTPTFAVAPLPDGLDMVAAAGLPVAFFTAWYALKTLGRLQAGERVLVHGGTGAVGMAAIQIAELLGAEIWATAGSPAKRDLLRLLGVDHVHDSRTLDFADAILAETSGEGVDVVLNSLAGLAMDQSLRLLRPFGRFLELGKRDFYGNTRLGLRPMRQNLQYFGIDADQLLAQCPERAREIFSECLAHFHRGELRPLPASRFPSFAVQDAFRFMQRSRRLGKIVIDTRGPHLPQRSPLRPASQPLRLDPEAIYLVTGGNRGLGWRSARRLIERGARKLALLSRSGVLAPEAGEFLATNALEDLEYRSLAVDVTDASALENCLQDLEAWGRIGGIVHAAAVIEDQLAEDLDAETLRRVLAPKVEGAWVLHRWSLQREPDFFVLLSSISNLLGNIGQGAYLAANGFLEALAALRRSQGMPATVLQLGPVSDAGFLTQNNETLSLLERRLGGSAIRAEQALDALELAIHRDIPVLALADVRWNGLRAALPYVDSARFVALDTDIDGHQGHSDTDLDWRARLHGMAADAAQQELAQWIAEEVAQILRLHAADLDQRKKLSELGFDSLMGMELALALEERLGMRIPSFILSEAPTIHSLASRLWHSLQEQHPADVEGQAKEALAQTHGALEEYRRTAAQVR